MPKYQCGGCRFWLLLPWLASGCRELRGSWVEDSGASDAGCSATGQMINHRFPVCRTAGRTEQQMSTPVSPPTAGGAPHCLYPT